MKKKISGAALSVAALGALIAGPVAAASAATPVHPTTAVSASASVHPDRWWGCHGWWDRWHHCRGQWGWGY